MHANAQEIRSRVRFDFWLRYILGHPAGLNFGSKYGSSLREMMNVLGFDLNLQERGHGSRAL